MQYNSDEILENIYTSYGPTIGKICQNTSKILNNNNYVNSETSPTAIVNSLSKNISNFQDNFSGGTLPIQTSNQITNEIINKVQTHIPTEIVNQVPVSNHVIVPNQVPVSNEVSNLSRRIIKLEPLMNKEIIEKIDISKNIKPNKNISFNVPNQSVDENLESTSYFNYKVSLFGYNISIWIILLIILIVLCIGYFIYKYCYCTNNFISYKKNDIQGDNILKINKNTNLESISNSDSNTNSDNSSNTISDTTTTNTNTNTNTSTKTKSKISN